MPEFSSPTSLLYRIFVPLLLLLHTSTFFCFFFFFYLLSTLSALCPHPPAMPAPHTHPNSPAKRRNITFHYDITSSLVAAGVLSLATPKKLKRMPHIFCRVLELPFDSETPVEIFEKPDCYTFVVEQPGLVAEEVGVEVVEIVPGATKVVVGGADGIRAALEELEVDLWRFRLPPSTLPEAARATYKDGVLTVTIPKAGAPPSSEVRLEKTLVETGGGSLWEQDSARHDDERQGRSVQEHASGGSCNLERKTALDDGMQSTTHTSNVAEKLVERVVLPSLEASINDLEQEINCMLRLPEGSAEIFHGRTSHNVGLGESKSLCIEVQ